MKLFGLSFAIILCFLLQNLFGGETKVYNIKSIKSVSTLHNNNNNFKETAQKSKKDVIQKSKTETAQKKQDSTQKNQIDSSSEQTPTLKDYYDLSKTIEKILPTVVTINAVKNVGFNNDYYDENSTDIQSLGSGFIISDDGYIITNNHVIDGAEKINIKLKGSDMNFPAEIVGIDETMDIALLKISVKNKLPFTDFDQSNNQKVGDTIIVAGNPYNLGTSVSIGIISALNRNLRISSFDNFIQTDASINKGNSGGPMFNIAGKVVGLTSAIYSPDGESVGIGFAMPVVDLLPLIEEIKKYGYVRRGWIGLTSENTQREIFEVLNSQTKRGGVIITDIIKNSPAEKAGLKISDIILSYDGRKIRNVRDLSLLISSTEIGSVVNVSALRKNQIIPLKVKVDEVRENYKYDPEYEAILSKAIEIFDMVLIPINKDSKKKFNLPDEAEGMYIFKIKKGGLADKKGIRAGDIILSINQDPAINGNIILENIHKAKLNKINYVFFITKSSKNSLIFMPIRESNSSNTDS